MSNSLNYSEYSDYILPTKNNPMMNVPIINYDRAQTTKDYYRYNNYNGPMSNIVKQNVTADFNNKLFMDPASVFFQKDNSQRQWYSMPNGSVPNDQQSFAESLYRRENVCKAGSIWMRYGVPFTDDSLTCTGFEGDGKVTNFGSLNKN